MPEDLTEAVYTFICDYFQEHGYPPSLREISKSCYLGRSSVIRHLDKLEGQGRILRDPGRARGMTLLILFPDSSDTN